jgi:hypothetical protein
MPAAVSFGITIRRCIRVKKNEGRLLEDVGIQPDVIYQMTFKDITEQNQDLIARASLELSKMPLFDLQIEVVPQAKGCILKCRTLNLTLLEASAGSKHVASAAASNGNTAELVLPDGLASVTVLGFKDNAIVARTKVALLSAA